MMGVKVGYQMCKACRRKAYRSYKAWTDFSEALATKGDTLKPPYIGCPGPIVDDYHAKMVRQVEDYVRVNIPEAFGVKLSYPEKKLYELGEDVPVWCPYKDTGWKPEDDMKMIWLNGEHVQDFAQRGKTYEFTE